MKTSPERQEMAAARRDGWSWLPVRVHIPADVGSNPTPAPSADPAHVFILLPPLPDPPTRWVGIDAVLVQRQHVGFPSRKCRFESDVSLHAGILGGEVR